MKINYRFIDGTTTIAEVSNEIGAFITDSRRLETNSDRRHRYHECSLDAIEFSRIEDRFGYWDKYAFEEEYDELSIRVRNAFSHLSDVQKRRLLKLSNGMTMSAIAEEEGVSPCAVKLSIDAGRKKFLKYFYKTP